MIFKNVLTIWKLSFLYQWPLIFCNLRADDHNCRRSITYNPSTSHRRSVALMSDNDQDEDGEAHLN